MLQRPLAAPACASHLIGFDGRRLPRLATDVLVIGGGLAGAVAALTAAEAGASVLVLAKDVLAECNTAYAQGGIAAVLDVGRCDAGDTLDLHLRDTLAAGAGLVDEAAARSVLTGGAAAIRFLEAHGCRFDAEGGKPHLGREGGHHARRILHAGGDATGAGIAAALAKALRAADGVTVLEQSFVIDLVTADGRVTGAVFRHGDGLYLGQAPATVLATGGCGRVWRETTNPRIATGDGLAMAYRAGALLADLEFAQFHPTTLYVAGKARLLITEAMRGEGAHLKNHDGERFLLRHHPDGELAPRDVVSAAIMAEIRATGYPHVWLDATHLGAERLHARFPTIVRTCAEVGIDITRDWIPVHPSAHYHCGGVVTDAEGRSTLAGLWACGECACTGLHGANRLASNSLLEAVVVGERAGRATAGAAPVAFGPPAHRERRPPAGDGLDVSDLVGSVRALMWRSVGIEREARGLAYARRSLQFWLNHQAMGEFADPEGWQLQNQILVGLLVASAAEQRAASVGTHRRRDSQGEVDPAHGVLLRPGG